MRKIFEYKDTLIAQNIPKIRNMNHPLIRITSHFIYIIQFAYGKIMTGRGFF